MWMGYVVITVEDKYPFLQSVFLLHRTVYSYNPYRLIT